VTAPAVSDVLELVDARPCPRNVRWNRERLLAHIEDYFFIGGDQLSLAQVAERLGVRPRSVSRWRALLRDVTGGER
jgi:hypothetical protein